MNIENVASVAATAGGGFFVGVLIGYALKKVIKFVAVVGGLFLAGLAYLQYHQIAAINWYKVEQASAGIVSTVINATKMVEGGNQPALAELAITNFGIPLTSSISVGFTIG